jgi:mannose-6-phosphate isomerase-like protein (cupin superfamily)
LETHDTLDQFFRVDDGEGKVIMDGEEATISNGFAFLVPAGTEHNVVNTSSDKPLKLYTIYMPPNHKDGIIHKTKHDAEVAETDGSDIYVG